MIDLWIKAAHVATMVAWLGGMLANTVLMACLSRAERPLGPAAAALAAGLRGWDRRVTVPAMLLTWAFGIALASMGGWFGSGWLSVKLAPVLALSALHGIQVGHLRRLTRAEPLPAALSGWSLGAAIPAAVLIAVLGIAVLAIVKPI